MPALLGCPFGDYRWIIEETRLSRSTRTALPTAALLRPAAPPSWAAQEAPSRPMAWNFHVSKWISLPRAAPDRSRAKAVSPCWIPGQPARAPIFPRVAARPADSTFRQCATLATAPAGPIRPEMDLPRLTPARSLSIPANATTSRCCLVMRATRFPRTWASRSAQPLAQKQMNYYTPNCGHTMAGAPIPAACNVLAGQMHVVHLPPLPNPSRARAAHTASPGRLSVIVFEDDYPLNGEQDGGGGNGSVAPIEPGLGGFTSFCGHLWRTRRRNWQDSNDMFNQPLSNSLSGTVDPPQG